MIRRNFLKLLAAIPIGGAAIAKAKPATATVEALAFGQVVAMCQIKEISYSAILIAYANKEKIYTTAQMMHETGASAVSLSTPPTEKPGYKYGWLKQAPTITKDGNKLRITHEFWLAQWSTDLYETLD